MDRKFFPLPVLSLFSSGALSSNNGFRFFFAMNQPWAWIRRLWRWTAADPLCPEFWPRTCKQSAILGSFWSLGVGFLLGIECQGLGADAAVGTSTSSASLDSPVQVVALQGTNWWMSPRGASDWVLASTHMPQAVHGGDKIRTGRQTRLFLQTPRLGVIQIPPFSTFEVELPSSASGGLWVRMLQGMMYFFHRGSPTDVEVHTRSASAAIRGTEFVAYAEDDGGLKVEVIDGSVVLSNSAGTLSLQSKEAGDARAGQPPIRLAPLYAMRSIQWCLYYPAVLDLRDLPWTEEERKISEASSVAYEQGDSVEALKQFPWDAENSSPSLQIYAAALWLAIGQVQEAESLLQTLQPSLVPDSRLLRLAVALRRGIAAVQGQPAPGETVADGAYASEWLAESYVCQSQRELLRARDAALKATQSSPQFGLAWARLAELEFGFGHRAIALQDLRQAMERAPRLAFVWVLKGFQESNADRIDSALEAFDRALSLNPALGDAWLGRGLCRIRRGHIEVGLADLEMAAAVEPQRALFRSYLAKAFAMVGQENRARKELELAKGWDPNDPTAWLYEALLDQQENRINAGIRNLERSKDLNAERRVYRSHHLLDTDLAVRSANLSALYRDAGLLDLSRREAVDAVNGDYSNFSGHLFLANTYNEWRDPGQVDLRYETPWFSEYLLANLLAPLGAGTLSQTVSAQEFSKLFQQDGMGLVSATEYRSSGAWAQSAAQYGVFGTSAYSMEEDYRSNPGQRANNDLEQRTLSLRIKQQLNSQDTVFVQSVLYDANGGDLGRIYDPTSPAALHSQFRFQERQEPLLFAGYHREWSEGQHTLFTVARLQDELSATDPAQPVLLISKDPLGAVTGTLATTVNQQYRSTEELYSLEAQHIVQGEHLTWLAGGRAQMGGFDAWNRQENLADQAAALPTPLEQQVHPDFHRWSGYSYVQWQVVDPVRLFGGLAYDVLRAPVDFRFAPVSGAEQHREQWSPKAGILWNCTPHSNLRAAYSRSLTGVSLDQSYSLEPTQIAGFNQAWRSLIPESAVGSQAGARLETMSLEWDYRTPWETHLSVSGEILRSRLNREVGVFDLLFLAEPSSTREELSFRETRLTVTVDQLVGEYLTVGAQYRWSRSKLHDVFPEIPGTVPNLFPPDELKPRQTLETTMHQALMFGAFHHPSGFFGRVESLLTSQGNSGYAPDLRGDTFWQWNVVAGYRFAHRRAEISVGVLNLSNQDYRLNPLQWMPELPRHRTLVTRLRLNF